MKIHHLNAGTFCPVSARLVNGSGRYFEPARMVCHCLLVETPAHGLVLVDTGLGLEDLANGGERLGPAFMLATRPVLREGECMVNAIAQLGFEPRDVRHIVLTHMDVDHAGGLADFPHATVHVLADEHAAATAQATFNERRRYHARQWRHAPKFELAKPAGEPWRGFAAARELPGLPPEILMLPLSGHTRGHACVAVECADGPLVHAGDAYFHRNAVQRPPQAVPLGIGLFEGLMAVDRSKIAKNHQRLSELGSDPRVRVFCAHDPAEFERLTVGSAAS